MAPQQDQPRGVRDRVKPDDLALAAYRPYQYELVGALWKPNPALAYYDIVYQLDCTMSAQHWAPPLVRGPKTKHSG